MTYGILALNARLITTASYESCTHAAQRKYTKRKNKGVHGQKGQRAGMTVMSMELYTVSSSLSPWQARNRSKSAKKHATATTTMDKVLE